VTDLSLIRTRLGIDRRPRLFYRQTVRSGRKRRHLWWWFLVPLGTLGFGTFAIILYAGLRLRSRLTVLSSLGYLGVISWAVIDLNSEVPVDVALATCMLGGAAHALYLSYRFSARLGADDTAHSESDLAMAAAQATIARRQRARRILEQDPILAAELRIGRPDLRGTYDDGGLIDLNHVPADTMVSALEMPPAVAAEIVEQRSARAGFFSADDLLIACTSLNPDRLDILRDRLVFMPRDTSVWRFTDQLEQ
jgi:hypothetical protein